MSAPVTFPGLGLAFQLNPVAFTVLGHPVYWYGIIIAAGFLLAVSFGYSQAKRFGVDQESLLDMLLYAVPLGIIGARLYYILYDLGRSDTFRKEDGSLDFAEMVRIWDGGLAIYGGIIAAALTVFVFCKIRKLRFPAYADVGAFGLLIGQSIGRWGNFVNVEVFGYETTLPWRMGVNVWTPLGYVYQEVHPTFLYESLWNALGFVLLIVISRKLRRFDGQMFLTYVLWYGIGRTWIEGVRQDYLPFFGLSLFGAPVRTSQVLAAGSAVAALALIVWNWKKPHTLSTEASLTQTPPEGDKGGDTQ